jgi:hypothetical protein
MFLEHVKLSMYLLLQATTKIKRNTITNMAAKILHMVLTDMHNSVRQWHYTCIDMWTGTTCTYRELILCLLFTLFLSFTPHENSLTSWGSLPKSCMGLYLYDCCGIKFIKPQSTLCFHHLWNYYSTNKTSAPYIVTAITRAVPWLRQLVAGLSLQRHGFVLRSVGFVVDKVALGQLFSEFFSFPPSI